MLTYLKCINMLPQPVNSNPPWPLMFLLHHPKLMTAMLCERQIY